MVKKATGKLQLAGTKRLVFVTGNIKDTRKQFGHVEYLLSKGKIDDIWLSEDNIVMFDKNE